MPARITGIDIRSKDVDFGCYAGTFLEDMLRPVTSEKLRRYAEKTGWIFFFSSGNEFVYHKDDPANHDPWSLILPLDHPNRTPLDYMRALETLAVCDEVKFQTILCRVLEVEQIVIKPE